MKALMSKLNPFLFFIILSCSIHTFSQSNISIDHYTKDYGKEYRWVYDITQDDKGFLWFGTHTGLRRYDGTSFLVYNHSNKDSTSISTNTIHRVTKDLSNNIWAYGIDHSFNKLNLVSGKFTKVTSFFKNDTLITKPLAKMKHFNALNNGDFIVMFQYNDSINKTNQCSLWKYIPNKNIFEHQVDVPAKDAEINYFSERADGKLWLWGMGKGYYLVDLFSKKNEYYPINNLAFLSSSKITIPVDEYRNFWYPSQEIEFEGLKSFRIPDKVDISKIERIRPDNLGNIWFYHAEQDLFHFDAKTEILEKFVDPIFQKSKGVQIIYHMFVDKEGGFWNGHFFGAIRFKKRPELFKKYFNQSIESNLKSDYEFSGREIIELSPNSLLVKENEHDLFIIDLKTQKTKKIELKSTSTTNKPVIKEFYSIVLSNDGHLWMNQLNRLLKLKIETGDVESFNVLINNAPINTKEDPFKKYVPRIFEDASGNLWWCDPEGLYIFDTSIRKMIAVSINIPPSIVNADFKFASYDHENDAIYGSYSKGVYSIDCKTKSVSLIEIFSDNESFDILRTAILKWKNEFWLSTNKGLIRYNPKTKERTSYTVKDGFPSNIIYSAIGGENFIWLGTQKGLCQFDPSNMQMATFYEEQGLPHNEFNIGSYKLTSNGSMYFGGQNGIVGFDPKEFEFSDKQSGQLNMVNISKYNQNKDIYTNLSNLPYSSTNKISINPQERTVSFKYMLAKYDNVNPNQYFHYMEGLDSDWINDGDKNEVSYLQIPPGNYIFRVKAKGPHKLPAFNEIAIPVVVKQYWYLRWWAITSYILLLTTALFALYRFQLNRKLDKQEALRIRELDDAKTKMYTNITHEFRTPLTVILGMNEAVKDYSAKGEIDKVNYANKMIDRNGKNLLNLVNQMLELSKLESGKLESHNQQGNIVDYLKYRLESFQSYAEEKGLQIHFFSREDEIMMDFDVDKISYIIGNLLSNAIKYTPEDGHIYVDISKQKDVNDKPYLELKVKDTGVGIEAPEIAHIFNRFYQVDSSSHTRKGESTGIGLSLVNELVKLLNGTIRVNSKINEGSEFIIILPITKNAELSIIQNLKTSEEWSEGLFNSIQDADAYQKEDQKIPLVLIVEDNVDVSHYIGASINDNYRIVSAKNGKEGIEKAITLIPDLIISDVMMPVKDGFELCETLKKDEKTSHIPIILLTGKTDIDSKIKGLEHGADAYLAKPFNRKELLIRLKNLLSLRAEIQKRYSESDFKQPITGLSDAENTFILKIRSTVLEHIEEEDFDITQLCKLLYISRAQLHRKLIALTGQSASHLIRKVQLEKAKELLSFGELNVSEVAFQVGFKTQAHFSRVFSEAFGTSPSNWRK